MSLPMRFFKNPPHFSLCLSTDILVLNFLGTPSVQPLVTLTSYLYSVRQQSLIFQKTNKEPMKKPEPFYFLLSVQNDVRELSNGFRMALEISLQMALEISLGL